jgi:uncharacterized protein
MTMGRIVFFILLALVGYLVFRAIQKRNLPPAQPPSPVEDMVRCARCGVNIPRSTAVANDGDFRCRDEEPCAHRPKA